MLKYVSFYERIPKWKKAQICEKPLCNEIISTLQFFNQVLRPINKKRFLKLFRSKLSISIVTDQAIINGVYADFKNINLYFTLANSET